MPVASAASLTSESFSATAFGMSPAKPTFICGVEARGSLISRRSPSRCARSDVAAARRPCRVVVETMRMPSIVPSRGREVAGREVVVLLRAGLPTSHCARRGRARASRSSVRFEVVDHAAAGCAIWRSSVCPPPRDRRGRRRATCFLEERPDLLRAGLDERDEVGPSLAFVLERAAERVDEALVRCCDPATRRRRAASRRRRRARAGARTPGSPGCRAGGARGSPSAARAATRTSTRRP